MDDSRQELTEIDRALADALDVDVSPGFAARVRQRIANETTRTPFWHGWRIAAAAVATALVIAAVGVAMLSTRDHSTPQLLAARSLPLERFRPVDARPGRSVVVIGRSVQENGARAAFTPATTPRKEPEVLVPREEIEMYRRLIAAAQKLPHAVVVESPKDIVPAGLITEITIDPIKIDLIIPPVSGEGDRQ